MYVNEPKPWMATVLKRLAELPFDNETFLSWGHTVMNGKPLTVASPHLTSFFLDHPHLEDPELQDLIIDGDPVEVLWVRPIAESERAYAMEHGSRALSELFESQSMDRVLDETRKPVV